MERERERGGGLLPPAPGKTEEMPGAADFGLGTVERNRKTIPKHHQGHHLHWNRGDPLHFPSNKVRRFFNDNYIISEEPKKNKSKRRQRTRRQNKKNVIVEDGLTMKEK
jgi:hypothetical protein